MSRGQHIYEHKRLLMLVIMFINYTLTLTYREKDEILRTTLRSVYRDLLQNGSIENNRDRIDIECFIDISNPYKQSLAHLQDIIPSDTIQISDSYGLTGNRLGHHALRFKNAKELIDTLLYNEWKYSLIIVDKEDNTVLLELRYGKNVCNENILSLYKPEHLNKEYKNYLYNESPDIITVLNRAWETL